MLENPTIGKWNDEENYEIKEPLWRSMLKIASKQGDITKLQDILLWLHNKNMQGDTIRMSIIGYYLCELGVDLEKELKFSKEMVSDLIHFSKQFETIEACVIYMMKKYNIHEEIIEEFKNQSFVC